MIFKNLKCNLRVLRIIRIIKNLEIFFFNAILIFFDRYFIYRSQNNAINFLCQHIEIETNIFQSIWSFIFNFVNIYYIFSILIDDVNSIKCVQINQVFNILINSIFFKLIILTISLSDNISYCFILNFNNSDSIFNNVIFKIDVTILTNWLY